MNERSHGDPENLRALAAALHEVSGKAAAESLAFGSLDIFRKVEEFFVKQPEQ